MVICLSGLRPGHQDSKMPLQWPHVLSTSSRCPWGKLSRSCHAFLSGRARWPTFIRNQQACAPASHQIPFLRRSRLLRRHPSMTRWPACNCPRRPRGRAIYQCACTAEGRLQPSIYAADVAILRRRWHLCLEIHDKIIALTLTLVTRTH